MSVRMRRNAIPRDIADERRLTRPKPEFEAEALWRAASDSDASGVDTAMMVEGTERRLVLEAVAAARRAKYDVMRLEISLSAASRHRTLPAVSLENPLTSMLWTMPGLKKLLRRSVSSRVAFCRYGTAWRKRTRLEVWGSAALGLLNKDCCQPVCCRTGKRHLVLEGSSPQGIPWTKVAEPYPRAFCKAFARCVADETLDNRSLLATQCP